MTQSEFGDLVGITQQAVSKQIAKGSLDISLPWRQALLQYCESLRDEASGRSAELLMERARLAREQADKYADEKKVRRCEYVPVFVLIECLSSIARQAASILEALPVKLKRETDIDHEYLKIVEREVVEVRNAIVDVRPDWGEIEQKIVEDVKKLSVIIERLPDRLKSASLDIELIEIAMSQILDAWNIVTNSRPDWSQVDVT